jgi:arabinan endo-1,5-alpha-L-arabinosidase
MNAFFRLRWCAQPLLVAAVSCGSNRDVSTQATETQASTPTQMNAPSQSAPTPTAMTGNAKPPTQAAGQASAGQVATAQPPSAGKPATPAAEAGQGGTPAAAAGANAAGAVAQAAAGAAAAAGTGSTPPADGDLCEVGKSGGAAPVRPMLSGNTFAHDPTMIEADGVYYRFWTGDNLPMASSRDLNNWSDGPAVYRDGYPQWSREWLAGIGGQTFNFPWAPDVSFFNGQYHIYSSFSAKFGDNISCITHLTTTDIASGDWTDHGPVICTKGDEKHNAIDADVGFDTDGKPYLAFGSFWDGIMAFPLDQDGARVGNELKRLAWAREIEAPVLFRRCGYYYLFVSHGLCCPGNNRTVDQLSYRVLVGRSQNILGPYLDRDGKDMVDGGGTLVVEGNDTYAAAGHSDVLVAEGRIYNLYHAYRRPRGNAELRVVELQFDDAGWPLEHDP